MSDLRAVTMLSIVLVPLIAGAAPAPAVNRPPDNPAPADSRPREDERKWRMAAQSRDIAQVKALLAHGGDLNVSVGGPLNEPPLFIVAGWGTMEMVSLLLERGADVNRTNASRQSVLMRAARNGNSELVTFLLNHGADATLRDDQGQLAMWPIGQECLPRTAYDRLLGKSPATKEDLQRALLAGVGGAGCAGPDILKSLLAAGADLNWQNKAGITALMMAAQWGRTGIVALLLEKGADVSLKNSAGQTARQVASTRQIVSMIEKAAGL